MYLLVELSLKFSRYYKRVSTKGYKTLIFFWEKINEQSHSIATYNNLKKVYISLTVTFSTSEVLDTGIPIDVTFANKG